MPLRAYLSSIGDSLVIGEDDEAFKVHVHTNIPGDALTESQKYGTLELAKIENMRTQADDLAAGRKPRALTIWTPWRQSWNPARSGHVVAAPEKRYGFLAVCAGDGLAAVFRDLGVRRRGLRRTDHEPLHREHSGTGSTRSPLRSCLFCPTTATSSWPPSSAQGLTEKKVVVIPTKTVPQGITAMMNVDSGGGRPQDITEAMTDALSAVTTAQITYAARNSDFDGFEIQRGRLSGPEGGQAVRYRRPAGRSAGKAGRGREGLLLHLPLLW